MSGYMNHGFYNLQPTFFYSFYNNCNFTDIQVFLIESNINDGCKKFKVTKLVENFNNMQYNTKYGNATFILTIATKKEDSLLKIPVQEFYQKIFDEKSKIGGGLIDEETYDKIVGNVPENNHEQITKNSFYI